MYETIAKNLCVSSIFYKIQNNNIDLQNVSENLGAEMQKNFSLVKSVLVEPVSLDFVPLKVKEQLAVKCQKELLFTEIVTVYRSFFFNLFFSLIYPLSFVVNKWEMSLFLEMDI